MKIVFDFNNLFMRTLAHESVGADTPKPNWDLWHQYMMENISTFTLSTTKKYPEVSDVVLACDWKEGTWRHAAYPPYKGNRVKNPEINWEEVHEQLDIFKGGLLRHTPWKILEVEGCEADDVIAVLTEHQEAQGRRTMIHSTDCDYIQLLSDLTTLYRPMDNSYPQFPFEAKFGQTKVLCQDPEEFIFLSVLTGQGRKDNIYNILTPTDWNPWDPVKEKNARMKPFGPKKAGKVLEKVGCDHAAIEEEMQRQGYLDNYLRNRKLIDFRCIPQDVKDRIVERIESMPAQGDTCNFLGLARANGWGRFMDFAEDLDDIYADCAESSVPCALMR